MVNMSLINYTNGALLRDALVRLPVILRSAVVLHDMLEMTTAQIAGIQGIGLPAAKQRLRRGRAALMRILASDAERRVAITVPLRCWEARAKIDDYLDRSLAESERRLLETHLGGCDDEDERRELSSSQTDEQPRQAIARDVENGLRLLLL